MGQPVEQGAGQPFGAEDLRPFVERQIVKGGTKLDQVAEEN